MIPFHAAAQKKKMLKFSLKRALTRATVLRYLVMPFLSSIPLVLQCGVCSVLQKEADNGDAAIVGGQAQRKKRLLPVAFVDLRAVLQQQRLLLRRNDEGRESVVRRLVDVGACASFATSGNRWVAAWISGVVPVSVLTLSTKKKEKKKRTKRIDKTIRKKKITITVTVFEQHATISDPMKLRASRERGCDQTLAESFGSVTVK